MSLMITVSYVKLKLFPHRFKKYLRRRENESDAASHLNIQYLDTKMLISFTTHSNFYQQQNWQEVERRLLWGKDVCLGQGRLFSTCLVSEQRESLRGEAVLISSKVEEEERPWEQVRAPSGRCLEIARTKQNREMSRYSDFPPSLPIWPGICFVS